MVSHMVVVRRQCQAVRLRFMAHFRAGSSLNLPFRCKMKGGTPTWKSEYLEGRIRTHKGTAGAAAPPPPSPTLLTHACMCVCTCRCLQLTCDSAHIGVCITSCESKAAKMSRSRPQCQWGPGSLHAGGLAIQMAAASDKETAADTSALSGDDATLGRSAL